MTEPTRVSPNPPLERIEGEMHALTCIWAALALEIPIARIDTIRERIRTMLADLVAERMVTDSPQQHRAALQFREGVDQVQTRLARLFADHSPPPPR